MVDDKKEKNVRRIYLPNVDRVVNKLLERDPSANPVAVKNTVILVYDAATRAASEDGEALVWGT